MCIEATPFRFGIAQPSVGVRNIQSSGRLLYWLKQLNHNHQYLPLKSLPKILKALQARDDLVKINKNIKYLTFGGLWNFLTRTPMIDWLVGCPSMGRLAASLALQHETTKENSASFEVLGRWYSFLAT